ncbi:FABP family protein [Leekyejoonella antrihumi]|uniref:Peroxynitrite isomerase n=1 Tax=Leekyejoonella antrihumi TaxID=1660198 RepID=A0A563E9H4_9MICO|nr:FABP family protein [Leekyejoonella antrihumi]TWP38892.1 FABP family protein [Leekyejoonella antrihumi]
MPFELDPDMPHELAPLAWLLGSWEGAGVVGYPTIESANFGQEITCSHDGRPFLRWESRTWLLDADGNKVRPLATELGFWRPRPDNEVEVLLTHPTGVVELYYGNTSPAKVELRTDGVLRSGSAKEYAAGSRLYGYVNSNLMWAMDMAAMGQTLQSHVSAELKRVA